MFIAKHKDLLKLFMWKIIWQNTNLILNFYFYLFYEIIIKIKIEKLRNNYYKIINKINKKKRNK